ncbi:MAG: Lrp/AsnC family transcriptional regulator [Streptomycetales bacterium]
MPNTQPHVLDGVDRTILRILTRDGRIPNSTLAEAVGIAPSTCLARVRTLRERGIIRGFHADLDLSAVGMPIQAMIAVRLRTNSREQVDAFRTAASRLPGVLALFHVGGENDYLMHVAAATPDALREFVLNHITAYPAVRHAETHLVFEHLRGPGPLAG